MKRSRCAFKGVNWAKTKNKWVGTCYDSVAKKAVSTCLFDDQLECASALDRLRAEKSREFDEWELKLYKEACKTQPELRGLTRAPKDKSKAKKNTVYWYTTAQTNHQPCRVVLDGNRYVGVKSFVSKQSKIPGVTWDKIREKWIGNCYDLVTRKKVCTSVFDDEFECASALKELRATKSREFDTWELNKYKEACKTQPELRGLTRAPKDALNAKQNVVYWKTAPKLNYKIYRAVLVAGKRYEPACILCNHIASPDSEGKYTYCGACGGGAGLRCAHGYYRSSCRECNPNICNRLTNCNNCGASLGNKRRTTNGGTGFCLSCDTNRREEAAANGAEPPTKGKSWEDLVLDELVERVNFPYEMRDDLRNMLGSNSKRRRGECDTTKQRRPDILYLVREPEHGRIVAALKVGVDEHSHTSYKVECESGKVDDQFQALQTLAAREGASKGAAGRFDARMIYMLFLKFNPNACDAIPRVKLSERVDLLVDRCNTFLTTPVAEFQRLSSTGEANVPHVECLYYHSVQGKHILDHFDANANGAWDWRGNFCGHCEKTNSDDDDSDRD